MCFYCQLHGRQLLQSQNELPDTHATFVSPKDIPQNQIDWGCAEYVCEQLRVHIPESIVPLVTTGDGNCLLHAISRAMWGVELFFLMLKQELAHELTKHEAWYKSTTGYEEAEWKRVVEQAESTNSYLSLAHVLALANVLKRPITVYASDQDIADYGIGDGGVAGTFLPLRIPIEEVTARPLAISWSSEVKNHYVPIVLRDGKTDFEYPILAIAFEKCIPEGLTADSYIHQSAEIIPPKLDAILNKNHGHGGHGLSGAVAPAENMDNLQKLYAEKIMDFLAARRRQEEEFTKNLRARLGDPNAFVIPGTNYVVTSSKSNLFDEVGIDDEDAEYDVVIGINLHNNKGQKKYSRIGCSFEDDPYTITNEWLAGQRLSKEKYSKKVSSFLVAELNKQRSTLIAESKLSNIPLKNPLMRFDARSNIRKIADKLIAFSEELSADPKLKVFGFSAIELKSLEQIVQMLQAADTQQRFEAIVFQPTQLAVLSKARWWPDEKLFPMLDLCRIVVLNNSAAEYLLTNALIFKKLLEVARSKTCLRSNRLMALKLIANMFAQDRLRGLMIKEKLQIIPVLELAVEDADLKIKEDAVVVLLNFAASLMFLKGNGTRQVKEKLIHLIAKLAKDSDTLPPPTIFRLLVALGTLMYKDFGVSQSVTNYHLNDVVAPFLENPASEDIASAAAELVEYAQSMQIPQKV